MVVDNCFLYEKEVLKKPSLFYIDYFGRPNFKIFRKLLKHVFKHIAWNSTTLGEMK